jgi:hypothetical protein
MTLKLKTRDAAAHVHVIGVSGSGKSRFLAGLYIDLLRAGGAATLIDPHGDLARLVLARLVHEGYFRAPQAFRDLLYLDLPAAARQGRYFPFNVLRTTGLPHTIAANVLDAFHRAWPALGQGQAPMFDLLVQNGVKVLISNGLPLPALFRLLVEKEFRDALLTQEADPEVVAVFRSWYDRLPLRDQLDQGGAALRRLGLLIFDPILKYSLAQSANLLDYRALLDRGQSVIVNLALESSEARRLLGCLLTVSAEYGALSRAEAADDARAAAPYHHLILDEFSEFTAQSEEALVRILSQTRKYGLFLVMAHQTWSQTSERVRGAIQNAGVEVTFKLGREDALRSAGIVGRVDPLQVKHELAEYGERSHPLFYSLPEQWEQWAQILEDLPPRHAYIRLPRGAVSYVKTINVPTPTGNREDVAAVEAYYLEHAFRSKAAVDAELAAYRAGVPTRAPSPVPRRAR